MILLMLFAGRTCLPDFWESIWCAGRRKPYSFDGKGLIMQRIENSEDFG
jgi:hypothetical protein